MSLMVEVLVLVLSFPAVGLLLYVLTVAETWLLSDPAAGGPRPRARRAEDQAPPQRQAVVVSLARPAAPAGRLLCPAGGPGRRGSQRSPAGRAG